MTMEQIMQAIQQNPQLLIQLVQALMQAGLVLPGPALQQGPGGGAMTPGGGPPGPGGGPGAGAGQMPPGRGMMA